MTDPDCPRCGGSGTAPIFWLYPEGKPTTEPCPRCYPTPPDLPELEPEMEPNDGPLLARYHGPGQWEIPKAKG
jgi:hypothetical protein